MSKIFILLISLSLGLIGQAAARNDIETISLESYGDTKFEYKVETTACNCFLFAENTRINSISITTVPCVSLKFLINSERAKRCVK